MVIKKSMQAQHFITWFNEQTKNACLLNERRLVVLLGSEPWALSLLGAIDDVNACLESSELQHYQAPSSIERCLIYGDSEVFPATVQKKRYRDKLGSESELIIFADSKLTIDAFAALSGTLIAGGTFFLVIPSINEKCQESLFFKGFISHIKSTPGHTIITQSQQEFPLQHKVDSEQCAQAKGLIHPLGCRTAEQFLAVKAIEKVVTGHRKRPLILTADRGRGKSSALAIACAQLMRTNEQIDFRLIITAPDIQALTVFFRQLSLSLPSAKKLGSKVTYGKATLVFSPVDRLINDPQKANLLMVDEAAAIPVYILEKLLGSHHRMVFSSTVHGYEGAGRGFTLKFQKILSQLCPQWQKFHIKQPIRWRENDPLEQLVFQACLLKAELPVLACTEPGNNTTQPLIEKFNTNTTKFKIIDSKILASDDTLLQQAFAILVTAHYQTKPSDLQLILDNPKVQLACLFSSKDGNADIIAVALLLNEGANNGVSAADIDAIKHSQRRLRNHFLPQSLLSHCGFEHAFEYSYLRIMRIAVHPQVQRYGIGCHFVEQISLLGAKQGIDFIGSSFGVNPELLSFWLKAGFSTIRIGFTKDKASGEHSALMIKGIHAKTSLQQQKLKQEFYRSFDYLLIEEYQSLSTPLVKLLLSQQEKASIVELSDLDFANVLAFSTGERLYSSCVYSLYLWLKHDLLACSSHRNSDDEQNALILIARLIQKHSSANVCQQYALTGKKMLNQRIKDYVSLRLKAGWD